MANKATWKNNHSVSGVSQNGIQLCLCLCKHVVDQLLFNIRRLVSFLGLFAQKCWIEVDSISKMCITCSHFQKYGKISSRQHCYMANSNLRTSERSENDSNIQFFMWKQLNGLASHQVKPLHSTFQSAPILSPVVCKQQPAAPLYRASNSFASNLQTQERWQPLT